MSLFLLNSSLHNFTKKKHWLNGSISTILLLERLKSIMFGHLTLMQNFMSVNLFPSNPKTRNSGADNSKQKTLYELIRL